MLAWTSVLALVALSITPAPREMRVADKGQFYLRADAPVVLADGLVDQRAALMAPLQGFPGGAPQVFRASDVDRLLEGVYVGIASDPGGLNKRKLRRYLDGIERLGEEGYRLVVEKNGVIIAGGGVRGVWHGLHTLGDLLKQYGASLPYMDVRDWPELAVRAVYLNTLPTDADLRVYAALKCTHVFLDSDAFYDLSGVEAMAWRHVFEVARENFLEPVPVFSTLHGMDAFLRDNPLLLEGRAVIEQVTLRGVDWVELRYPNIVAEHPEDLVVTISGVRCTYGRDYWIEAAPLVAPFLPERPRWRIRRELEGSIPNGAEVAVRYNFATDDSGTLCFGAPESRAWLEESLERLIRELEPRYIHLDHGRIGRLNADSRSGAMGLDDGSFFVFTLELLTTIIERHDPTVEVMMWSDLLSPFQSAPIYGLETVAAQVPTSVSRLGRVRLDSPDEAIARFEQLQPMASTPFITFVEAPPEVAGVYQQMIAEYDLRDGGLIVPAVTPEDAAPLLAMAWGGTGQASIWTRRLNRYFDTTLGQPDFAAVRGALVRYLNEATLRGEAPKDVSQRFDAWCGRHLDVLYEDEAGYSLVKSMFGLLTEYLALEERYAATGDDVTLRKLPRLVTDWQALEPEAPADRYARIVETISTQQLFVPATILFQEDLRYYRPDTPEHPRYEIPVRPAYHDAQDTATATFNLMQGQAAVRRIDFESVQLDSAVLAGRFGAEPFEDIRRWTAIGQAGVRGPLLLPTPTVFHELRLTAGSRSAHTVLRDVRLYGPKEPAVLDGVYAAQAPAMVAAFEGRPWSAHPQAGGFLRTDTAMFAAAPTAVWACRTRSDIYIGIAASDPQPDTIVADLRGRDQPLWRQESVELWLQPEGRLPLRLIVSPSGAHYDSEADDAGWDGAWEVVTRKTETGWNALFRLPVALTGDLARGASLPLNVVRNRHSVEEERSAWAHRYGAEPDLQWGELRFP